MSEQDEGNTSTITDDEQQTEQTGEQPDDVEALRKALATAQASARRADALAKQNQAAARKLAQLEDASKSEQQRAVEAQKAAEDRASKAEGELLRLRIAADHNLSPSDARRLIGSTEDELRTDAAAYAEEHKRPATTASRRPSEALRSGAGGSEPDEPVEELDPDKLAAQVTATH